MTMNLKILDHNIAKKELDQWTVKKTVSRDGQDLEVVQKK